MARGEELQRAFAPAECIAFLFAICNEAAPARWKCRPYAHIASAEAGMPLAAQTRFNMAGGMRRSFDIEFLEAIPQAGFRALLATFACGGLRRVVFDCHGSSSFSRRFLERIERTIAAAEGDSQRILPQNVVPELFSILDITGSSDRLTIVLSPGPASARESTDRVGHDRGPANSQTAYT